MKKFWWTICVVLLALLLSACGKKDDAERDTSDDEPVPTIATVITNAPTPPAVEPTPAEMLIGNLYLREIEEKEPATKEYTLKRISGGSLHLSVTSVELNGTPYPYEIRLQDTDGTELYHYYTVEEGDVAYQYEIQHGVKKLVGARSKFYCPWITEDMLYPEMRMEQVLSKLQNLGETYTDDQVGILNYELTDKNTATIGCINGVYILLKGENGVPGTYLTEEVMELYNKYRAPERFTAKTEDYPSQVAYTDSGLFQLVDDGTYVSVRDSEGNNICTIGAGSGYWGDGTTFLTFSAEGTEFYGIPTDDFFDALTDPHPSKEEPADVAWIRRSSFEDAFQNSACLELMAGLPLSEASFGIVDREFMIWYNEQEGDGIIHEHSFGDLYPIFAENAGSELAAEGDIWYRYEGIHYGFSGRKSIAETGVRTLRVENMEVSLGSDPSEGLQVIMHGMNYAFGESVPLNYIGGFPDNLAVEYVKDNTGRITSEVYYAGNYELGRINYVYDRDADYSVPKGEICSEYAYFCGTLYWKAVHFYSEAYPFLCIVCCEDGKAYFVFDDGTVL